MDDLQLLASFLHESGSPSFAEEFLRNMLDFTSPTARSSMLVGLRWHFLLGTLPITFRTVEEFRSLCAAGQARMLHEWESVRIGSQDDARRADSSGAPTASTAPVQGNPGVSPSFSGSPRLARFDSSSSSSSSSEGEDECQGMGSAEKCGTVAHLPPAPRRTRKSVSLPNRSGNAPANGFFSAPVENPLCPQDDDSFYAVAFRAEKIRREVQKDIDRLHWELPLFEEPGTKKDIADVLLHYCLSHNCEYKQGMHEIVAFLFYIGARDRSLLSPVLTDSDATAGEDGQAGFAGGVAFARSAPERDVLRAWVELYGHLCATENQLACTYALFSRVMSAEADGFGGDAGGGEGFGLEAWFFTSGELEGSKARLRREPTSAPTTVVCGPSGVAIAAERVQQDLLLAHDAELLHRLDSDYGIQGAAYLIRWLRLLFLRELSFGQSALVWSVLFAEMRVCRLRGKPFDLQVSVALHIATAMLMHIRSDLMRDSTQALRRLMHFPVLDDVRIILAAAVRASTNSLLHVYATLPRQLPPLLPASLSASEHDSASRRRGAAGSVGTESETNGVMARQGARVAAIISRLEPFWFPAHSVRSTEEERVRATNEYVQAIAELKKVRDVLLFGIDD